MWASSYTWVLVAPSLSTRRKTLTIKYRTQLSCIPQILGKRYLQMVNCFSRKSNLAMHDIWTNPTSRFFVAVNLSFFSHRFDYQSAASKAKEALHRGQEPAALLAAGSANLPWSSAPRNAGGHTLPDAWGRRHPVVDLQRSQQRHQRHQHPESRQYLTDKDSQVQSDT